MLILGIDLGVTNIGFALTKDTKVLKTKTLVTKKGDLKYKVAEFYNEMMMSFQVPGIEAIGYEEASFTRGKMKNYMRFMEGVVFLVAGLNDVRLFSYSPIEVKIEFSNNRKASKKDMLEALKVHTTIDFSAIDPDNVTNHEVDAIAVAYCVYNRTK